METEHDRKVAYWERYRADAIRQLGVTTTRLAELGVIYPLHLVEDPEPDNIHQLRLEEPEDGVA